MHSRSPCYECNMHVFPLLDTLLAPQGLPAGLPQASFLTGPERRFIQLQQSKASKSVSGSGAAAKGAIADAEAFSDWRLIREACCNWRVWYISIMVRRNGGN